MGIPSIKLNLVPEPSLWRERHLVVGWSALALGVVVFLGASGFTVWSYHRASQAGKAAVTADAQTRFAATQEHQLLSELKQIDVDQELPRWRLAELILSERAAPWSRLVAELEQSLVDGSRIKNVERTRGSNQSLLLKVKAEARSREAESGFIENLRKDPVFTQVALEREAQEPGGGWEFDLSLPVTPLPPPFVPTGGRPKEHGDTSPTKAPRISNPQESKPSNPAPRGAAGPQTARPTTTASPRKFGPATGPRGKGEERPAPSGSRRTPAIQRRPQPGGAS